MKETKVYTGRRNGKHAELMQRLDKALKEQHFAFVFTKQELKVHDRELVKEVCEKIEDWCNKNFNWVGNGIGYDGQDYNEMIGSNNTINKLRGFLNQIQKEAENE